MNTINELDLMQGIKYWILESARKDKGISYAQMEDVINVAEGTCKNILTGRTKNPGVDNLNKICKFFNIHIQSVLYGDSDEEKTAIEIKGIKEGDISVIALKEIYEKQLSEKNATNEKHTEEIRAHYEQHHNDLKENFEKRLHDKREIIESKDKTIEVLESKVKELESQIKKFEEKENEDKYVEDLKSRNKIKTGIITVFTIFTIILFVAEFIFMERGWLRF